MEPLGYIITVIVAALVAALGQWLIARKVTVDGRFGYLLVLGLLGGWGGSRLFGPLGPIESLSKVGPSIGGFYLLAGILGALVLVLAAVYPLRQATRGEPTDVARIGIRDPQVAHWLFNDTRSAPLWLGVRLYLGYQWLEAGWHKLEDPGWTQGGTALKGFWERAVAIPESGRAPIVYGWYRDFIQFMLDQGWYDWFAWLVIGGQILVGLGLIVGGLVGIAAFFGAIMNLNFMLAGTASTNPVLFSLGILLILAWKVAGYWGIDRYLLPALGAPWSPGRLFRRQAPPHGHA